MTSDFVLDPRLANDTATICDWALSRVLLMNDRRFQWLVLVPRRVGAVEAFDLNESEQTFMWREVTLAARLLKDATLCRKINIGALGNIVSQLHVHVVARDEGDAAWPGAVWGKGVAERYGQASLTAQIECYRTLLRQPVN